MVVRKQVAIVNKFVVPKEEENVQLHVFTVWYCVHFTVPQPMIVSQSFKFPETTANHQITKILYLFVDTKDGSSLYDVEHSFGIRLVHI